MANFKIGQKIICVNDDGFDNGMAHPIKNKIYSIESFSCCNGCGVATIVLKEIISTGIGLSCTKCNNDFECNKIKRAEFRTERFRPLQYESAINEILEKLKITEEKSDVKIKELEKYN